MSYIKLLKFQNGFPKEMDASTDSIAVQEITLGGNAGTALTKAILDTLTGGSSSDATSLHSHDSRYYTKAEVNSAIQAASQSVDSAEEISYSNSTSGLTATNVQAAIDEVEARVDAAETDIDALEAADVTLQSQITQNATDIDALEAADVTLQSQITQNATDIDALEAADVTLQSQITSAQGEIDALETYVDATFIPLSQKGAANGVATLGSDGKLPTSQLPALAISDVHVVADIAARDALTVEEGDVAKVVSEGKTYIYDGSQWIEITADSAVDSVNGQTGNVVLDSDDVSEGSTNLYFTESRAKDAAVVNTLAGNETDQAPSVAAVKAADAALQSEIDAVESDLAAETSARQGADTTLQNNINTEAAARAAADATFVKMDGTRNITIGAGASWSIKEATNNSEMRFKKSLLDNGSDSYGFHLRSFESDGETTNGHLKMAAGNQKYFTDPNDLMEMEARKNRLLLEVFSDYGSMDMETVTKDVVLHMEGAGSLKLNNLDDNTWVSSQFAEFKHVSGDLEIQATKAGKSIILTPAAGGHVSVSSKQIKNVANGSDAQDAVTKSQLDAEAVARDNADLALQNDIDAEQTAREAADAGLQANITNEATARAAEDLTFLKLDGSRSMSGTLKMATQNIEGVYTVKSAPGYGIDMYTDKGTSGVMINASSDSVELWADSGAGKIDILTDQLNLNITSGGLISANSKKINDLAAGTVGTDAINKSQLDTTAGTLQSQINAATSSLSWKPGAKAVTADADLIAATDGTALSSLLPFSDDDMPTQLAIGDFAAGDVILSSNGASSKLFDVYDDAGTLKVQAAATAIVAGDTMTVKYDLLDSPDSQENLAIYHFDGSSVIKIGDMDWSLATGITISGFYSAAAGTVVSSDTVEAAIEKLDGNVANEASARAAAVSAEASARSAADSALETAIDAEEARALAAEGALQSEIDAEEARALAAEAALQSEIDTEEAARISADAAEASARAAADAALQSEIDAEEAARAAADTALQDSVRDVHQGFWVAGETLAGGDLVALRYDSGSNSVKAYKASAAAADNADFNNNGRWDVYGYVTDGVTVNNGVWVKKFGMSPTASFDVAPSGTDCGKSVYLSTTAGKCTFTPPSGSGDGVVFLGRFIGMSAGIDFRMAHLRAVNA